MTLYFANLQRKVFKNGNCFQNQLGNEFFNIKMATHRESVYEKKRYHANVLT